MSTEGYNQHISQQFNTDLEEVRTQFLQMGGLVEQQVKDAIKALIEADKSLANQVQDNDKEINGLERSIDESIVRVLALRQPAASDLRMVIAISKGITDIERIGDESSKIARIALKLAEEGESPRGYEESRHIGSLVSTMLNNALDSLARLNVETAIEVLKADQQVDREYQTATRALMTYMMEDPRHTGRVINVLWVLRSLERIGDHARNVAEQVIYMVKGKDVRHTEHSTLDSL